MLLFVFGFICLFICICICFYLIGSKKNKSQITSFNYGELLQRNEWLNKREEILKRDNYMCTICKSTDNLQVHHKYYINNIDGTRRMPWDYPDDALVTLCDNCHKKEHGIETDETIINISDNISKNNITEVAELFNTKPKYNKKGFPVCAFDVPNTTNTIVWMPQQYSSAYHNEIIDNGNIIHEYPKNNSYRLKFVNLQIEKNEKRIVFYKFNKEYVFIGVYKLNIHESKHLNKCVWTRISDSYKIT